MKFPISTVFIFLLSSVCFPLAAQWQVKVLNTLNQSSNTDLHFIPINQSQSTQKLQIEFSFWTKENRRLVYERKLICKASELRSQGLRCKLPLGNYECLLSIQSDGKAQDFRFNHSVYSQQKGLLASDIILTLAGKKQPIPSALQATNQRIQFKIFYQSKRHKDLTIRAVLYKNEPKGKQNTVLAYASIAQHNYILGFSNRKASFSEFFSLKDLKEGEYLVEILPYEDDKLLGEWVRSAKFEIEWSSLLRLKSKSSQAIQMMKYILPPEEINALLSFEKDKQFAAMQICWKQLYPKNAQTQMQQYFKKILQAEKQFREGEIPGWQTDRARIFVQYGSAPQQRFERIRGRDYLRWMYPDWGLSFLFEKCKQNWLLIE